MTPATALSAAIVQLKEAGLTEARSPLGVSNQPASLIDRSFSVFAPGETPVGDRGRDTTAGVRVRQELTVTLAHRVASTDGLGGPEVALRDTHAAIRALLALGTALDKAGPVEWSGSTSRAYAGSGAYLLTTIPIALSYNLDLSAEVQI